MGLWSRLGRYRIKREPSSYGSMDDQGVNEEQILSMRFHSKPQRLGNALRSSACDKRHTHTRHN